MNHERLHREYGHGFGEPDSARVDRSGSSYMRLANALAIYGEEEGREISTKILGNMALSGSTQDFLVEAMGRRSVRKDGTTPPGLPPLGEINTIACDSAWAAGNRERSIETFTQRVIELGK